MDESDYSLWFKIAHRLIPLHTPKCLEFPNLDTSFSEPGINIVNIPQLLKPEQSKNFCPVTPKQTNISTSIISPGILNANDQIGILSEITEIPQLFEKIIFNGKTGKDYRNKESDKDETLQLPLDAFKEICIHGAMKPLCEYCSPLQSESSKKKSTNIKNSHIVNIFDLLLPLLQPPLGENFDSNISIPQKLFNFQRVGVKFLVEKPNALLADEMGTGKSIQAIVALRFLIRLGKVKKGLVICPKSILSDWDKKFWDWAPELQTRVVRGNKDTRLIIWKSPNHVCLVSYDTLRQDIDDIPINQFDLVVLDEIQRIKNPDTETAKAIRMIQPTIRWGLSGTPLENRIEELIAIYSYLKPNLLHYDDANNPIDVKRKISPYFLRRRLKDVKDELELGEKVKNEIWLELKDAQRESYEKAKEEGIVELNKHGEAITIQHVLALIGYLKQICNRESLTGESCKLEYLIDVLENDIDEEEKVLVFSQYPEKTLKPIQHDLEKFGVQLYSGQLTENKRNAVLGSFENDQNRILLISIKAGGLGLTITSANHVFHFDHWWNPAIADQAEGRAYRRGQTKTVFVTTLFTINTIEEDIHKLLANKRHLFQDIVDDLSDTSLSALLSEDELFGLFGLRSPKKPKSQSTEKPLEDLSPYEFEDMISKLCREIGYAVRETKRSRDGGVDLYAKRDLVTGTESLIIQCKHYPNGVVGVEKVRELYGVLASRQDISRAVLITSGQFSSTAIDFASGKNLKLINGDELKGILIRYKISPQ
jgi:SNF2 family DNA or RNA helicase